MQVIPVLSEIIMEIMLIVNNMLAAAVVLL
jgi:hypothetical protein